MSLPSGYKRLEYIESTGTQYIDTGFRPNQDSRVICDYQLTSLASGQTPFMGRTNVSVDTLGIFYGDASTIAFDYGTNRETDTTISITSRMLVDFNKNNVTYNGKQKTLPPATFQSTATLTIFARHTGSSVLQFATGKLYACQIYDNGTIIRDFTPCKNADGVVGLWDAVNGMFYANAGTGVFTAGPSLAGVHKTLVNGTTYEVKGGKCLVNGTVYSIKKGRTLIGGTGYDITFAPSYDPVFANNTWEQIIEACHNNAVPDTWKVADHKSMTINGVDYQIDIIGKNHDDYADGSGKAPLTFQLHDCYRTSYAMNTSKTKVNSWNKSDMRLTRLPAIFALMPTEVQSGIREVNKLTSSGSRSPNINTTADKLFLLSEIEIFGSTTYSFSHEGTQYDYYMAGNSRMKYYYGIGNHPWWERSPHNNTTYNFCNVTSNGDPSNKPQTNNFGVAFGFCF